jgi:hypothetical protein
MRTSWICAFSALTVVLFAGPQLLRASEFTIKQKMTVEETGYSSANDPVEAFENAVEQAKRRAASSIGATLRGGSSTEDGAFTGDWAEKKANVQIFDVKILEKTFVSPGEVRVRIRMTAGYLNAGKFWREYDKTVKGASFRTAVVPGWGQVYNREYFSAGLYGVFYAAFYGLYLATVNKARTDQDVNKAFVQFQLPALVFWSLAVSDASISRFMVKFGLEQIKQSYQASAGSGTPSWALLDMPVMRFGF